MATKKSHKTAAKHPKPKHVCIRCGGTPTSVHRVLKVPVCRECLGELQKRVEAFDSEMKDKIATDPGGVHCVTIMRFPR